MPKDLISSVVLENYANGREVCEGIKRRETCEDLPPFTDITVEDGLGDYQCNVLDQVLGRWNDGEITAEEKEQMSLAGFPNVFIDAIAGEDGRKPVYERVETIRSTIFQPPTFINMNTIKEIEEIGADAISTIPVLLEEIDFITEGLEHYLDRFPSNYEYMQTTRMGNRAVRAMIAAIVGSGSSSNNTVNSLIEIFDNEAFDGETQARAAEALGLLKSAEALPYLKTAAWGNFLGLGRSTSDSARVQAALATSLIDEKADMKKVTELITRVLFKNNKGSVEAARALGKVDCPESRKALMEALRKNPDYTSNTIAMREEAARSLGRLKATEAIDLFSTILSDESINVPVCRAATWALGEIGTPDAIVPLRLALRNGAASVHFAAAEALMKIDEGVALDEIRCVMNFRGDDEERLEKMAAVDAGRALLDIGLPDAFAEIEKTIKDPEVNKFVRTGLYRLLRNRTGREIKGPAITSNS